MDWLQKALDKSKQSDNPSFQFQTSSELKKSFFLDKSHYSSEFDNPAKQVTPPNQVDDRLLLTKQTDNRSIAVYNFLSAKTIQLLKGLNVYSLALTSPTSGSGNTLTAANLAISISRTLHEPVVLVELDLRKPSFYRVFGLDTDEKGLGDHLTQNDSLEDLLININGTDLTLLPAGSPIDYPNILGSKKMRQFVLNINTIYQNHFIIYDLPSLLDSEDSLAFLPNIDSSILVVEEAVNTANQVNQCIDILKNHEFLGTILNKARDVD